MKLTNSACDGAKPQQKRYNLSDGQGMYLEIRPNGAKYWRLAYRMHGKQKTLALGVYPEVSLKQAREKRREARKLIEQGIDPSKDKQGRKRKASINALNTFKAVALEWHENQKGHWSDRLAFVLKHNE